MDTNDRFDIDFPNMVWSQAGGTLTNDIKKLIVGYDPDSGSGGDSEIIPAIHHDLVLTTDGTDIVAKPMASA